IGANPFNQAHNVPINTVITLQFDKPVDPVTVNNGTITVYDDYTGQQLTGTYALSTNAQTATFAPSANLGVGRSYHVYWGTGVHALAGSPLTGGAIQFTTAFLPSNTPPRITLTTPENGQTGVPINGLIEVQFNEPIQPLSIGAVTLNQSGTPLTG